MSARRAWKHRSDGPGPLTPASPQILRQSSWPLVVVAVTCLVAGGVLVERLTRPVDELIPESPVPSATPAEPAAARPISPLPATPEETILEVSRAAEQLVRDFPDSAQALTLGGQVYYAFGNSTKAVAWWEKCLKQSPDFAEARCALGTAAWDRGDFPAAVASLQKAFEGDPRLLNQHIFCLADSLMNLGKAGEVVALLEKAAKTSPLSPAGRHVLGQAYLQLGEHDKARQQFEAVLAADPRFANAHYALSRALVSLGKVEEAKRHREEYAKLKPQDLAARDRAQGAGRSADKMEPADVHRVVGSLYASIGKIYATRGRPDEAEKHWLRAAACDPRHPEPRQLLQLLYRDQGRREEATQWSRDGQTQPMSPEVK